MNDTVRYDGDSRTLFFKKEKKRILQARGVPPNELVMSGDHDADEGAPVTCTTDHMQMLHANKRASHSDAAASGEGDYICAIYI